MQPIPRGAAELVDSIDEPLFEVGDVAVSAVDLAVAVGLFAAFLLAGRWVRAGVERLLRHRFHGRPGLAFAIARMAQYAVVLAGVVIALDQVGIHLTAIAATGAILALGIGIGLQDITKNVLAGLMLLLERHVQKGDFIIVGDTVGTVQSIELRATRVVSRDGVSIIVPNADLVNGTVVNQSQPTPTYRLRVGVGVAYGSDVELVRDTLLEVAAAHPRVLADPKPTVFFEAFGASSLDFVLAAWVREPQPEPAVQSDLRFAIDHAFRERGITIAFPQLDLHVVSGLEGLHGDGAAAPAARQGARGRRRGALAEVRDTASEEEAAVARVIAEAEREDGARADDPTREGA